MSRSFGICLPCCCEAPGRPAQFESRLDASTTGMVSCESELRVSQMVSMTDVVVLLVEWMGVEVLWYLLTGNAVTCDVAVLMIIPTPRCRSRVACQLARPRKETMDDRRWYNTSMSLISLTSGI